METSFQTGTIGLTLGEIAAMLGGELHGPADFMVGRLGSAETPDPGGLGFAESSKYVDQAKAAGLGALLVGPNIDAQGIPAIRVANPRLAFFMLLTKSDRPYPTSFGIHATAVIDATATVHAGATIGPYAVIGPHTRIELGARVYAHAYVGEHCTVGVGASVFPHAVLLRNVELGERSVVFPGAVLGGEGFGFVWDGKRRVKIPQVGRLVIGPDCEVGALTAIDRATAGETTLGVGTKVDNLVQIAHNCHVGDHVVIAGLSGVAGSSTIGDRVIVGGQTAVSDHISICDDVVIGGRAGVESNITEPGAYLDFPARPAAAALRNMILRTKLTELVTRIRALEKQAERLKEQ